LPKLKYTATGTKIPMTSTRKGLLRREGNIRVNPSAQDTQST